MEGVLPALVISALAGLSTALGGVFTLFSKRTDERFLSFSLGFAAGVMILVSFCELLPDSTAGLAASLGPSLSGVGSAACLALGVLLAAAIEKMVPQAQTAADGHAGGNAELTRTGVVTAAAITAHNLPEGIATFMAGYADVRLGIPVALAVALHNIPEGISVAAPVYYGTGSRAKAFFYALLSGLSEPLGAVLAFVLLGPFLNQALLSVIFGSVAGIMLFISFESLLPASRNYGHTAASIIGVFAGVLFMLVAMTIFGI